MGREKRGTLGADRLPGAANTVDEQHRDDRPAPSWPPAGSPPAPAVRRRWPWVVAVVLLFAVAGAAVGVAWEQRSVAAEWRDRAVALEAQRDEAVDRNRSLERQLGEVVDVVGTSERDVAELEDRVRELAGEKALAEDEATTIQVERDVFVDLSTRVTAAVDSLDACVTRLFDLLGQSTEAYNAAAAGEFVDVEPLNAAAQSTTSFCNDARTAAANAAAAADQLLRR